MEKTKSLSTLEEIKVFSDPYRIQILRCFKQLEEPATVKQVADEMGEVPAKVHYHVKKMEKVGILELVYTKEINGIIAKYYSPTAHQFTIQSSDYESPMFNDFLNKTQKLFSNIFDDAKRIFVEQFQSTKPDETVEMPEDGFLTSAYVHLTIEQYKDLNEYIRKMTDENKKKDSEEKDKYFIMTSIVRIQDKEDNK